jgi:transcriptional regulator with XRE-family HTH domain
MSTRKCDISDSFPRRLKQVIEFMGFNKRNFANEIGVSPGFLGDVLSLRSRPSYGMIQGIALRCPSVNIHWLLTGQGPAFEKDRDAASAAPPIDELLSKARKVLAPGGHYAASLFANIESLHKAIEIETSLEDRVALLEKGMRRAVEQVRKGDPPEKKGQLIKKRAIQSA